MKFIYNSPRFKTRQQDYFTCSEYANMNTQHTVLSSTNKIGNEC